MAIVVAAGLWGSPRAAAAPGCCFSQGRGIARRLPSKRSSCCLFDQAGAPLAQGCARVWAVGWRWRVGVRWISDVKCSPGGAPKGRFACAKGASFFSWSFACGRNGGHFLREHARLVNLHVRLEVNNVNSFGPFCFHGELQLTNPARRPWDQGTHRHPTHMERMVNMHFRARS